MGARARRFSVLMVALATFSGFFVSGAGAALPLYPLQFSATSAHGTYQVLVETGCYSQGEQPCGALPTSNFLYILVVTSPHPGNGCPANEEFQFTTGKISSKGSFSVTQAYQGGLSITVQGRFPTSRSVIGEVSGTHGCATSGFAVTLPRPLIAVAPAGNTACYWLIKAGIGSVLASPRSQYGFGMSYDLSTGLGQCDYDVSNRGYVGFNLNQQSPGVSTAKRVSGLGPNGFAYAHAIQASGGSVAQADAGVYFRVGSVWVSLGIEVYRSTNIVAVKSKALTVARHLYQLLQ